MKYLVISLIDWIDEKLGHPWYPRLCTWLAESSWWGPAYPDVPITCDVCGAHAKGEVWKERWTQKPKLVIWCEACLTLRVSESRERR